MMSHIEFDTGIMLEGADRFISTREISRSDSLCPPEIIEAGRILGQGFHAVDTLSKMEADYNEAGLQVNFLPDALPTFRYSLELIEAISKRGRWRVLLNIKDLKLGDGFSYPLTIENITKLSDSTTGIYEKNQIALSLFHNSRYLLKEQNNTDPEWVVVGQDILEDSRDKTIPEQSLLLQIMEEDFKKMGFNNVSISRRTPMEAIWNELVTLEGTGNPPLMRAIDLCKMTDPRNTPYDAPQKASGYLTIGGPLNSTDSPINVRQVQPGFKAPFAGVVPVLRIKSH